MILTFFIGVCLSAVRSLNKIYRPPAISEIDRNTPSEQSDALTWRLPAEQVIKWGNFNMGAPRHYLECNSVERLSGLSNN
jgi:hypothetical protein